MALKTAKMFKDFLIDATETGVKLSANGGVTVYAKNDNFANQITIKSDASIDFFAYKYITFDNSAIFSIDDVIENNGYYTLFISFVGNVKFDIYDEDIYIDGVSANNLQRVGIGISELMSILGINTRTTISERNDMNLLTENSIFMHFIKIRFSECPQNLSRAADMDVAARKIVIKENAPTGKDYGDVNFFANFSEMQSGDDSAYAEQFFNNVDAAFTVFLPVPYNKNSQFQLRFLTDDVDGKYTTVPAITIPEFLARLNALINDLTLSAELVLLSQNDIRVFNGLGQTSPAFDIDTEGFLCNFWGVDSTGIPNPIVNGGTIRDITNPPTDNFYPCLCMGAWKLSRGNYSGHFYGMSEVLQPERFYFTADTPESSTWGKDEIFLQARILGNLIDLSTCPNSYIVITRGIIGAKIWTDWERRIGIDIEVSIEFARDAYSNYEAYKKANITLVQRQATEALQLRQEQERKMQTSRNIFGGMSAGLNIANNIVSGNPIGAIMSGAQSLLGGIQKNVEFNMQQANERANLRLSQEQELERARETIIPGSELSGSVQFSNVGFSSAASIAPSYQHSMLTFCTSYSVRLSEAQMRLIERYIFENAITEKVINQNQLAKPLWQTLHNFFQVKIKNKNPLSARKAITIYVEKSSNN